MLDSQDHMGLTQLPPRSDSASLFYEGVEKGTH